MADVTSVLVSLYNGIKLAPLITRLTFKSQADVYQGKVVSPPPLLDKSESKTANIITVLHQCEWMGMIIPVGSSGNC